MPALIGLSPRLADQTFPRNDHELRLVAQAVGRLSELVDDETVQILRTDFFAMLLGAFQWDAGGSIKNQLYTHLNLWLLNGKVTQVQAETGDKPWAAHPVPVGCRTEGKLEDLWAEELGKIVVMHDGQIQPPNYFIGVACEHAFAGQPIGAYEAHTCTRCFPLVGPDNCDCEQDTAVLSDAYVRQVPEGYTQTEVSFEQAKKNLHLLGGDVITPRRGSHYKVKFQGERSWVLDKNHDPVVEDYLRQLMPITGLTLEAIAYTLREGQLPPLRFRLGGS